MVRHIFIINPVAGKGTEAELTINKIHDGCEVSGVSYDIYRSTCKGDVTNYVRQRIALKPRDDIYRFYACGGDGTLMEVVNGAVNEQLHAPIPGIHIGCVPIGTGNDFVRNFEHREFFLDITKQLLGEPIVVDCFAVNDHYGINMFNVGFDCEVAYKVVQLKKKFFIPKNFAYIAGIAITIIKNLGCQINVTRSDGSEITRDFELCAVANGGYCGGGFYTAPYRKLDDGLLDISLINKISRIKLLNLIGSYKKGTHLETKQVKKIVAYTQEKFIKFRFNDKTPVSIDGEIEIVSEALIRAIPKAVSFLLPVGVVNKAPLPVHE